MTTHTHGDHITFHHVHMYADALKPLEHYQALQKTFNTFSDTIKAQGGSTGADKITSGRAAFEKATGATVKDDSFKPAGQDVVESLITGMGFRVTGYHDGAETRAVAISSGDMTGAKFVVSAIQPGFKCGDESATKKAKTTVPDHFRAAHIQRFLDSHNGRQGVAVMAFETQAGVLDKTAAAYAAKHPKLLVDGAGIREYSEAGVRLLEVYAYYKASADAADHTTSEADVGTVLRFIERGNAASGDVLPGLATIAGCEKTFPCDGDRLKCYSDHWVSNVINRKLFLSVLNDTLGFTPKVDFNAGVVAAGEAVIESTVAGNAAPVTAVTREQVLLNQQQIYLPINNALSEVGHVHMFLDEIGQGIQHIASRVSDLVAFIARVNEYRQMTGQGFTFLNIPRSYYGRLTRMALMSSKCGGGDGCSATQADAVLAALDKAGLLSTGGIVELDVTSAQLTAALAPACSGAGDVDTATVVEHVGRARYNNMYTLLGDHLSEESYLAIVRNKILVDIQGDDILYQIFTCNILQRETGQESPFLEFIQRVCSQKKDACGKPLPLRPGCGGFGIRNFLTLFLSIEVNKAMNALKAARAAGDASEQKRQEAMVDAFTAQLDESNPVLTAISDAMTAEADALLELPGCADDAARARVQKIVDDNAAKKLAGQEQLKSISERYVALMGKIRVQK